MPDAIRAHVVRTWQGVSGLHWAQVKLRDGTVTSIWSRKPFTDGAGVEVEWDETVYMLKGEMPR